MHSADADDDHLQMRNGFLNVLLSGRARATTPPRELCNNVENEALYDKAMAN